MNKLIISLFLLTHCAIYGQTDSDYTTDPRGLFAYSQFVYRDNPVINGFIRLGGASLRDSSEDGQRMEDQVGRYNYTITNSSGATILSSYFDISNETIGIGLSNDPLGSYNGIWGSTALNRHPSPW